jgi:hypothetical protein
VRSAEEDNGIGGALEEGDGGVYLLVGRRNDDDARAGSIVG